MPPSSSALPPASANPALRRTLTSVTATDSESSAVVSPSDSPRPSASSTSLSSLSSIDVKPSYSGLVDTYGNPFVPPDFTIKDIRDAIPKHCFHRSALRGYAYILRDLACITLTFVLIHRFVTPEAIPSTALRTSLWALYTILQGLFGTGIWVLAHECGHGAFSPSRLLNDITGWFLHSALLVPYFSWQISHAKHHKATGHMERDMVFLPRTRQQYASRVGRLAHELADLAEETPAYTLLMLLLQQLVGWPNYLLTNVTGHNFHHRQREGRGQGKRNGFAGGVNHFDPRSPLYDNKDAKLIILSDIGILLALSALVYLSKTFGWYNMAVWYFIPYLWVNHWLGASLANCLSSPTQHPLFLFFFFSSFFPLSTLSFPPPQDLPRLSCFALPSGGRMDLTNTASNLQNSRHHLSPTHGPFFASLHGRRMEFRPRRRRYHRPRHGLCRPPPAPRNHRDPRSPSLRQHHPLLPC